jgi:meiosis-specific APC/C activator protein AMA1
MPFRVLDAPSLTNDFYTNVVSWSTKSNRIAVGLASDVYLWHEDESAYLLDLPDGHLISCVSFSEGDHIIIATKEGKFFLFSQTMREPLDDYFNNGSGICCIAWSPKKLNGFFAGDDTGEVLYFEVDDRNKLELVSKFKCQQQQVCGIAVGYDGNQISVGGNDNSCTIWDITNIKDPKFKFHLPHQAAVKALAYCPWSRSLLATGGGSKDRTIRFWHTNSGTLLDSIQTKGQITSLIWSTRKKQITLTFGFGEAKKSKLIAVYSYPQMEELVQVEATPNLRALSAVLSPDSSSICVVANDETVRFYQLWDTKDSVIMESQEGSVFGSDLIDLCEGIAKSGGSIR